MAPVLVPFELSASLLLCTKVDVEASFAVVLPPPLSQSSVKAFLMFPMGMSGSVDRSQHVAY